MAVGEYDLLVVAECALFGDGEGGACPREVYVVVGVEVVSAVLGGLQVVVGFPDDGVLLLYLPQATRKKKECVGFIEIGQVGELCGELAEPHAVESDALAVLPYWPQGGGHDAVYIYFFGVQEVVEVIVFDEWAVVEEVGGEFPDCALVFYLWDDGDGERL